MKTSVTGIVLAAGTSSRMGAENKLTLAYSSNTIIATVVEQLQLSELSEIIVVLGHEKEKIEKVLKRKELIFCHNPNYLSGMTSSIQAGVRAASKNATGFLICLSDMPFLTKNDYNKILQKVTGEQEILLPFYQQQKGNPVYFSQHFRANILAHQEKGGCQGVVQQHKAFMRTIVFDNNHILIDIDTRKDYAAI